MTHQLIPPERINSLRKKMKENVGWTDEELDTLTPKQWLMIDRQHRFRRYKMIAEVVQINGHCELNPKIGDKYVFANAGMLKLDESTFPGVCLWALAGMFPVNFAAAEQILAGLDPNEIFHDHVACLDLGLGSGGLGQVIFKIYFEKV